MIQCSRKSAEFLFSGPCEQRRILDPCDDYIRWSAAEAVVPTLKLPGLLWQGVSCRSSGADSGLHCVNNLGMSERSGLFFLPAIQFHGLYVCQIWPDINQPSAPLGGWGGVCIIFLFRNACYSTVAF